MKEESINWQLLAIIACLIAFTLVIWNQVKWTRHLDQVQFEMMSDQHFYRESMKGLMESNLDAWKKIIEGRHHK